MTDPDPVSVADHEASHTVVWWWWWASTPEGRDPGTGREIWCVTIESEDVSKEGEFVPCWPIFGTETQNDRLCLKHVCAMGLAGPVSDGMQERPRLRCSDEEKVKRIAIHFFQSREKATSFLEDLRPKVQLFLERTDVQAMVQGLKKELLEHITLTGEEAVKAIEASR